MIRAAIIGSAIIAAYIFISIILSTVATIVTVLF